MAQAYSDPKSASDPYSLPDIETFYHECGSVDLDACSCTGASDGQCYGAGWYWWPCFPGCLPDGDPVGPFATEAEALADAREGMDDDETEGD